MSHLSILDQIKIRQGILSIFKLAIQESQIANFVANLVFNGRMGVKIWHNMRFVTILEK